MALSNKSSEASFNVQPYAATRHTRFQYGPIEISTTQTERNVFEKAINEDTSPFYCMCVAGWHLMNGKGRAESN